MAVHRGVELYTVPETVSALTAHAVNCLDLDDPCCPHECAPCAALFALHTRGAMSAALRPYVNLSGADWDWWSADGFDWQWVLARWCDLDTCENRLVPLPDDKFDWL